MGQIFNVLGTKIVDSTKCGDKVKTNALRNLKTELMKFKTSKEGSKICSENGGEIPDATEVAICRKMVKELKDNSVIFAENGRQDIADSNLAEMHTLEEFLPTAASEEEIRKTIEEFISTVEAFDIKQMGACIKYVKTALPNADGKTTSDLVRTYLK